jgi:hypothetical protein
VTAVSLALATDPAGITVGEDVARALGSTKRFELTCDYSIEDAILGRRVGD